MIKATSTPARSAAGFGVALLLAFAATLPEVSAQGFGKNKVRYETFDFRVYRSATFDVLAYPPVEQAAVDSALMLERWNSRYRRLLGHTLTERQPVILYANHTDFAQTNAIPGLISQGVQGVTEGRGGRVVLPLSPSYAQNDHVLGHELVHAFHFDLIQGRPRAPLWVIEGIAEYATRGAIDTETAAWLRDALLRDELPSIADLSDSGRYSPYRWGHALWAYIAGRYGDEVIGELYRTMVRAGVAPAVGRVLETSVPALTRDWHAFLRARFGSQVTAAEPLEELGRRFAPGDAEIGISPLISPDGRYVAFFGRTDAFSLELLIASVEEDAIVGSLSTRSRTRHFDALRFTNGAGAFSPDGTRIAFVVEEGGRQGVAVATVPSLEIQQTLFFDEIEAISQPAWHPEGRELALTASSAGVWDLYQVDLAAGRVTQLTDDRFSQMHPTYAPDGESIVYSTDRTDLSDIETLTFRGSAIERLLVADRSRTQFALPADARHISPHLGPEGDRLFFVSDLQGAPNIYRYEIAGGTLERLSNVPTAVSGIARWAPALSVTSGGTRAVVTVVYEGRPQMRLVDLSARTPVLVPPNEPRLESGIGRRPTRPLASVALSPAASGARAATLGPSAATTIVSEYLGETTRGLPSEETVITSPYRGRLSVAEITQLFFGIGASAFGTTVYGGASASFADLLGNHRLLTAVQVYGGLDNASAFAGYRNRTGRIGWGIDASHVPRETRSSETETEAEASEAEDADEVTTTIRERRVFDRVDVVGEYPLTRNLRFEGGAGYTNIRFERIEEDIGRTNDGEIVYRQERTTRPESPINLVRFPIAFVGDYARFGYTGPLRGRRFRFQAEPTVGSIRYLSARADYREYVYLQPFSIAMRALHVGRYFAAGREEVLAPLSLGFPTLVRGYAPWTFSDAEDPVYQSTQGNRIAAAGIEFRAPLFGPSGIGLIESSPVPLTLLAFLDAGAAWFDADLPEPVFDQNPTGRVPLTSIGAAGRVNFGNVILLEIFWAYPFQRTDDRTITGLRFRAGY